MIIRAPLTRRPFLIAIGVITTFASLYILTQLWFSPDPVLLARVGFRYRPTAFAQIKDRLVGQPLGTGEFGELGRRVQTLTEYTAKADAISASVGRKKDAGLILEVEELALSMFPWIRRASSTDLTPLRSLRHSFVPNSRGIVIPVGVDQFRFAAHLIAAIRDVLHSDIPIQVAYAGDDDLPHEYREALVSLGSDVEMLDVVKVFNGDIIQVGRSWAIKPFAMLASKFSETILLDADTVLLQDPAIVFSYAPYTATGTYLFHDRLIWQHAFQDRHRWWEKEIGISLGDKESNTTKPMVTSSMAKSKVYMDDFAEEQDSGMVVMDKSRLEIVTALLHICWQNTPSVRNDFTYRLTYGDKDSWWFGLELCGVEYAFEDDYGGIAGEKQDDDKVCSFNILHPDANNKAKLFWYNGSLLKNKVVNATEFQVAEFWMMNAPWLKGATGPEMSCMVGGEIRAVDPEQAIILQKSVELAKQVDDWFKDLTKL